MELPTPTHRPPAGSEVALRPLRPGEEHLIAELVAGLTAPARAVVGAGDGPAGVLVALSRGDTRPDPDEVALGLARWYADPARPGSAELVLVVAERWRGAGLGRALLTRVLDQAATAGIEQLTCSVSPERTETFNRLVSLGAHLGQDGALVFPVESAGETRIPRPRLGGL